MLRHSATWQQQFFDFVDRDGPVPPPPPVYPCRGLVATTPLGYRTTREGNVWSTEIDDSLAPLLRECFRLVAQPGSVPREVWKRMVRRGLTGWSGRPMSWPAFRNLILNPFYVGLAKHDCDLYKGPQEPLIDLKTWRTARRNLLAIQERSRRDGNQRHSQRYRLLSDDQENRANSA